MPTNLLDVARDFVTSYWLPLAAASLPALATAILAYIRRPKSSGTASDLYLSSRKLLLPPLDRPAYSDRMAYVLAEMSDLAYFQFENTDFMDDAVTDALRPTTASEMAEFLTAFSARLLGEERALGKDFLRRLLEEKDFLLLDVIDVAETQGFICKRTAANEPSYLVLAFRGTEKKVSDWLTDARCVPRVDGGTKVHTGFHEAFAGVTDVEGDTAEKKVKDILAREEARDARGDPLPLFVTGHSLGGALALLATQRVAPDVDGACYTFGAPRVANYEYFGRVKTPVYRIVNSSDIVPRVPPGAGIWLLIGVTRGTSWLFAFVPPVAKALGKLEAFLDTLNGYRHFGDLRYLSDVAEGRFEDVQLLSNPPAVDRVVWMWRHIAKSVRVPIKSHSMFIYRKKLRHIANSRNP